MAVDGAVGDRRRRGRRWARRTASHSSRSSTTLVRATRGRPSRGWRTGPPARWGSRSTGRASSLNGRPRRGTRPDARPAHRRARPASATASRAALAAPSTATVATGMPLGICTVASRASRPSAMPPLSGTPIDGERGVGGHRTGQVGGQARAADDHPEPGVACRRGEGGHVAQGCGGRTSRASRWARRSGRGTRWPRSMRSASLRRAHQHGHLALTDRRHRGGQLFVTFVLAWCWYEPAAAAMSVRTMHARPGQIRPPRRRPGPGRRRCRRRMPVTASTRPPAVRAPPSGPAADAGAEHRRRPRPPGPRRGPRWRRRCGSTRGSPRWRRPPSPRRRSANRGSCARRPAAASASSSARSLRRRGSTTCASGSPKRTLYSSTLGPSGVSMNPAYRTPR